MTRYFYASVTRITDFPERELSVEPRPRSEWATGDYVVGEVLDTSGALHAVELPNGRMIEVCEGDHVVGALGTRAATLEAVGDWRAVVNNEFEALTAAGLFGKTTSRSAFMHPLMPLRYQGHVQFEGRNCNMRDYAVPDDGVPLRCPVVLVCGTSMSAGKTMAGRVMVRALKHLGYRVAAAKFTGAARYRDVLSFADAGADTIFDFVDAGLPSTVCEPDVFRRAIGSLLGRIAQSDPDVLLVEAGASPLEPYNGAAAIELLSAHIRFMVLCASDPYAVLGVAQAFDRQPDLVAGGAANTSAARELVEKLSGLSALNLMDKSVHPKLSALLDSALGLARNIMDCR